MEAKPSYSTRSLRPVDENAFWWIDFASTSF